MVPVDSILLEGKRKMMSVFPGLPRVMHPWMSMYAGGSLHAIIWAEDWIAVVPLRILPPEVPTLADLAASGLHSAITGKKAYCMKTDRVP